MNSDEEDEDLFEDAEEIDEEDFLLEINRTGNEEEEESDENADEFDIEIVSGHGYLFNDDTIEVVNIDTLREFDIMDLKFVRTTNVVFPGQSLPMNGNIDMTGTFSRLSTEKFVVLLTVGNHNHLYSRVLNDIQLPRTAVVAKISKYTKQETEEGEQCVNIEFTAIQRCQIIKLKANETAKVKILPELEMSSFQSTIFPPYVYKSSHKAKREYMDNVTVYPKFVDDQITMKKCDILIQHFSKWFTEENLKMILETGLSTFSYWVSGNLLIGSTEKYKLLEENYAEERILNAANLLSLYYNIDCTTCNLNICHVDDIIRMSSKELGGHFVNPGGFCHDLVTVKSIGNFMYRGFYCSEYSWFPGYAWRIIECARCRSHLGWSFYSKTLKPKHFFALTRNSIRTGADEQDSEDESDA